eukprot:COSAG06_NODE_5578_length_3391_cov_1.563791_6_plen_44_part_00
MIYTTSYTYYDIRISDSVLHKYSRILYIRDSSNVARVENLMVP